MAKPDPFRWVLDATYATRPNSTVVVPAEARKEMGWGRGQKIPAQAMNWALHLIDEWIRWFDAGMETRTFRVTGADGQPNPPTYSGAGATGWLYAGGPGTPAKWVGQAGTGVGAGVSFPLRMEKGQRLLATRAYVKGHTTASIDIYVIKTDKVTGAVTAYGPNTSAASSTVQMIFFSAGLTNDDDDFLEVLLLTHGGSSNDQLEIYGVEYDVDRP